MTTTDKDRLNAQMLRGMRGILIGIGGRAGAGKDTFARILAEELRKRGWEVYTTPMAEPLKRICKDVFDFSDEQLYGPSEERERPAFGWDGLTPRKALQTFGMEGRALHPDVWVRYAIRTFKTRPGNSVTLIPDVRFDNEALMIGTVGYMIVVERDFPTPWQRFRARMLKLLARLVIDLRHPSERGIRDDLVHFRVDNNGSLEELREQAQRFIRKVLEAR